MYGMQWLTSFMDFKYRSKERRKRRRRNKKSFFRFLTLRRLCILRFVQAMIFFFALISMVLHGAHHFSYFVHFQMVYDYYNSSSFPS